MTFSIVAWDPTTKMTGVAVATKHLAVGALVPHAKANVGAIATQAQTNPLLGIRGLKLLSKQNLGKNQAETVTTEGIIANLLAEDEDRHYRQLHLVDRQGRTAAWTGSECIDWAGHLTFANFSVAGNMLVGERTLTAMADAYQEKEGMEFCERLLQALEAGEAAGGDKRGRQSAALYIVHHDDYPHLDLRIDHHDDPIAQLRYIFEESGKEYYQSFRKSMPTKSLRDKITNFPPQTKTAVRTAKTA